MLRTAALALIGSLAAAVLLGLGAVDVPKAPVVPADNHVTSIPPA
ncbi:hypothetical protein GCM10027160_13430 [Streptomyces calidiresistens]|nr:hypothetical protein [Streptomyces calidiresistens]